MKATDLTATTPDKPYIMLKDLIVEAGKTISHQSIFTAGKIKIIGRGPNNKIIPVSFKIFEYGADRELINGKTGDDWAREGGEDEHVHHRTDDLPGFLAALT